MQTPDPILREVARRMSGFPRDPALDYTGLPEPWCRLLAALDGAGGVEPMAAWQACMAGEPDQAGLLQQILTIDPNETPPPAAPPQPIPALVVPELPSAAQLSPEQQRLAEDAGQWLDLLVDFLHQASPLTPTSFHVAAGLFLVSLVIARRLHLAVSTRANYIRPSVGLLFVGQSTRPRKTTALSVLRGLLHEAGLDHLLLPERQTPESLLRELTTQVTAEYDTWTPDEQAAWLRERAFAAQRGLLLEEASHLFDSLTRDYSAGLLPLILELADSRDHGPRRITIGRGREVIRDVYFTLFGVSTYGGMAPHMKNQAFWHNGLFARLAIVASDGSGDWQFWSEPLEYPAEIVNKLQFLAGELLPAPSAEIRTRTVQSGGDARQLRYVDVRLAASTAVEVDAEARQQWERYARAVGWDMLPEVPEQVPSRLYASYGRLGTLLVKVAILLAALDAECLPVRVRAQHIYRAQEIVESWRAALHNLDAQLEKVAQDGLLERMRAVLSEELWTTRRELLRALGKPWSELSGPLADLEASGEIERRPYKPSRGAPSEEYRRC